MRYEPTIDNEEQHIAEMAAYFREQLRAKHHGMLVLFASGRQRLEHVADVRYFSRNRATSRATGWWSFTPQTVRRTQRAGWASVFLPKGWI